MIYIGIPVYNERHTIGPLLWRIRELLYGERREFRVLVCDDASDDGTDDALSRYPRVLPLTILRHEARQGYSATLQHLVQSALERSSYPRRDALVTLQADFTDAPERVPAMIRRFEGGADLVTVARDPDEPKPRRLARLGSRILARGLHAPASISDPYASLRLYRLFALARAVEESGSTGRVLSHEGWAANAELLLKVWPHLRRFEELEAEPNPARRYRETRFRAGEALRASMRAGRDTRLRDAARSIREATRQVPEAV